MLKNNDTKAFIHRNISKLEPDEKWVYTEFNKTFSYVDLDKNGTINETEMEHFLYSFFSDYFKTLIPPRKNLTSALYEQR
jgi:hypothetical protein